MIKSLVNKIIKNRVYLLIAIGILLVSLITLGRAYIQSTLSIVGNTKIYKNSWVIHFDNNITPSEDSKTPLVPATIVDEPWEKIEFGVHLEQPGDIYEFTVDTVNDGSLDAMVDSVEMYPFTEEQLKYLEFDVRYDTGEEIKHCDPLYALGSTRGPNRRKIIATLKFKDDADLNDYPKEDVDLRVYFKINYVDLDDACPAQNLKDYKKLTIRPNGGLYNNRKAETRVYLEQDDEYQIQIPERTLYNFKGWRVIIPEENGTYTLGEDYDFTMGEEDVTVEAIWEEGDYVARIMDTYYPTIQDAFNDVAAKDWEDNTVWLLRDTTEYPVNNTRNAFTFNLDGHTVTGTITNSSRGNITLVNGRVEAEADHDEAFINNGLLNLGIHDGVVEVDNSIALVGNAYGLVNNRGSKFYFYDGYLEGKSGLVGGYTGKEENHYVFVNHVAERNCQKVYLVKNPNRAVAKTLTNGEHGKNDGEVYYYNLQDGINTVVANKKEIEGLDDTDYILYAIRDFEAAYELEVNADERILLDLVGYEVQVGKKIMNHGYLKIYNDKDTRTTIKPSMSFENDGELTINNVNIIMTTDSDGIKNTGRLDIQNTSVHALHAQAVRNTAQGEIAFDATTDLASDTAYALLNSSPNLVVDNGTIYGMINDDTTGNVEVTGDAKFRTTFYRYNNSDYYAYGILNRGSMKQTGGDLYSSLNDAALTNIGTYTITGGTINSTSLSVRQYYDYKSGTINVEGGTVTGLNKTIDSGAVNVRNNAELTSSNGPVTNSSTLRIYSGKVYSDRNTPVTYGSLYVYGGELIGTDSTATGLDTFYIEGGKVTSDESGISCSNAVIHGGTVEIRNSAISTSSLNMTGGTVKSLEGTGITVNSSGVITGGKVIGDIYGIRSNGEFTLGADDGDISSESPELIGGSYGLYITGPITNFFDGILKGQIDGYNEFGREGEVSGRITGTPLGGTIGEGTDEIDGEHYETDFIIRYDNWIRVGETEYNTINAASLACPEEGTCLMEVFRDAYTTYTQTFIDENNNKNITFDLAGHHISGTQTIYNNSTVIIIDSSEGKTGTIEPDRVPMITNTNSLTLDDGNYLAYKASSAIYNRQGSMVINKAKFRSSTSGIENAASLRINDIDMESTNVGIKNMDYVVGYTTISSGSINMYGGTIKATNTGITAGGSTIHIHGGLVEGNSGISGGDGGLIVSGGKVHAKTGKALENYYGSITVEGGEVIADNDIAVQTAANTYISGGYVEGTTGVEHKTMCNGWVCWWNPQYVSGGTIVGTVKHGVVGHGDSLDITGGSIYGEIDGVQNIGSDGTIGRDEGSISTSVPLIQGKRYGLYTSSYIRFYDGILKGKELAHSGLISQIPDATMIKDDYEFINREEYKTQYLVTFGDWLEVRGEKFNSLTTACRYATLGDTIYVIADAYVGFAQEIPAENDVVFDLNGHQLIMTQPIEVRGTVVIKNTSEIGAINNLRDNTILNNGNLTIQKINLQSNTSYAIRNNKNLTVNDVVINTYGGIDNASTLTVNGGTINGTTGRGIYSSGTTTVNGGTISSNIDESVYVQNGWTHINGGNVVNDISTAVYAQCNSGCGHVDVSGGEISGKYYGININHGGSHLTISGGHIQGTNGYGIRNIGEHANITGGVIEGTSYGYYNEGATTLGADDGTISIDLPVIKGDTYGLYIAGNGTVNFYDGILKGITNANYGQITNIPNRSQIFIDEETIDNKHYETKYLIMETDIAKNLNTGVIYSNLQDSLDEAGDNETVQLLTNVPLYYSIVNNNQHNFTLDLNGYTISTNKPMTNNGKLTITNSSNKEAFIKTSSAITLITNTNTLYLEDVTVKNTSSDRYVVYSNNTLSLNGTKIDAINGVQTTNVASFKNANIVASRTAIDNSGVANVDGGTYQGGSYSYYSNSGRESTLKNATFVGNFYNNRGTLRANNILIDRTYYENSFQNNGTMYLVDSEVRGEGTFSNSGTLEIDHSIVRGTGYYRYNSYVAGISNSGNLKIKNSEVHFKENDRTLTEGYAITNSGTLRVEENSIVSIGISEHQSGINIGIRTTGSGNTIVDNSTIKVNGGSTGYGVYVSDSNSHATILTGNIEVKDSRVAYGAYANYGIYTMGHYEGVEAESELVSDTNPRVYASGSTRGIGVKKVNGQFEFYDGIVWGSRYAKPETTTLVEKLYEVTTYVDQDTGFEYAVLEYMGNDYQGKPTALFHNVYYQSLQEAIDVYYKFEGEEIKLLKPVSENINVSYGNKAIVNLNSYSVTGKVTNNGELQVYNGSLQSFDEREVNEETGEEIEPVPTVTNNGTFIMGLDDSRVSSTNTRIIAEGLAIDNHGTMKMYDGYIEGNPTINGEINEIAEFARIHTVNETQYERKYLQSLDEAAIRRKETALIVTIDPLSGFYDNKKGEQHYYLFYEDEMEIKKPRKRGCDFVEWIVSDESAYTKNTDPEKDIDGTIKMDVRDIKLTAVWRVSENAVAKIGDEYYDSLIEALEEANDGEVVELLKDTEEDITVTKEVTINLGGHRVTGAFINQGILTLINGEIKNPDGIGILNLKTLTLGILDENVEIDSVRVIGTELGLQQDGRFNFYDGNIQGSIAMLGTANSAPKGFSLYTEHIDAYGDQPEAQKLFLSGNPENAVASIEDGGTSQFYFKLTDAIASAKINGKQIKIERDFEATYEITVPADANIVINMNSHNIITGNNIVNNGELLLYDNSETSGSITSAKSVTNEGKLTIQGIKLHQNKSVDTLINNGELIIKDNVVDDVSYPAIIESTDKYAVVNNGDLQLLGNFELNSTGYYALKQNGTVNEINTGKIVGIVPSKDTVLGEGLLVTNSSSSKVGITSQSNAKLTINGTTINTPGQTGVWFGNTDADVTFNSGTITASNCFLFKNERNKLVINDVTCTATDSGINNQHTNNTITLNDGTLTGDAYGFYSNGYGVKFTMNDGTLYSKNNDGIRDDYCNDSDGSYIDINGGNISGPRYGLYKRCTRTNIDNATIETRSWNRDNYALYLSWTDTHLGDGANILAEHASGIWAEDGVYIDGDALVYAGAENAYGINTRWLTFVMNDGKIYTPGRVASSLYSYDDRMSFVMNGGEIESGNIGLNLSAGNNARTVNINGGSIKAETYGVYQTSGQYTTSFGKNEDELSTSIPFITGGLYGIYKTAGTLNYYNGRLRGQTNGYTGDILNIRPEMEITTINEVVDYDAIYTTYSTENVSETPTSDYSKQGNGFARITYIGEDNDICVSGEVYEFSYRGAEDTFTVPCSGKFKLETWGAQGGRALCDNRACGQGGYGAYSVGEINLNKNEVLYINVGGQGENGVKNRCAVGGYNGGGAGHNDGKTCDKPNDDESGGAGGGATHIATVSGLLSTLENSIDSILIVSGGGGGPTWDRIGAGGGGFIGGTISTSPTQTATTISGYAFGKGQDGYNPNGQPSSCTTGVYGTCSGSGGGGGGYYGGYTGAMEDVDSGTGGSGYIGNSRLTNAHMTGYNVPSTDFEWKVNFLIERDNFLMVGDKQFNSFNKAVNSLTDGEEDTIYLLKDVSLHEDAVVPAGKKVIFDLNGNIYESTKPITNNGELKVINSSTDEEKEVYITNPDTDTFINSNKLTIEGVTIKNTNTAKTVLYGNTNAGIINVKDSKLIGANGIIGNVISTINFENSIIEATNQGIVVRSNPSTINFISGEIKSSVYGIRLENSNNTLNMTTGKINSSTNAIWSSGIYNKITIDNGNITSTGGSGIYLSSTSDYNKKQTLNINHGKVSGTVHGIDSRYANIYLYNDTEVYTSSTNRDHYAVVSDAYNSITINDNVFLNAPNASGIYTDGGVQIKGGRVYAGAANAYGIYAKCISATISGGSIETPGASAYGIYASNWNNVQLINITGGTITSGYYGIDLENTNSQTRNLTVTGGSITGGTVGIYENQNYNVIVGSNEADFADTTPVISGGRYGIVKNNGTLKYYSGIFKGYHPLDESIFNEIKADTQLHTEYEVLNTDILTNTNITLNKDKVATSNYAKEGDGYARITYLGNDGNSTVINDDNYEDVSLITCSASEGKVYNFYSIKDVQTFVTDCDGQYKLEVWGAQGGYRSNSANGGKGGYSSGIINLKNKDTLYVYVGAQGNNGGWNGGGSRPIGHGGGGATDIRFTDSIYSRVIVAGGGGSDGAGNKPGGYGGGLSGQSRTESCGSGAEGATQTSAGNHRGAFGQGGSGLSQSGGNAGAGGGGWYGGGGATPDGSADDDRGGGGGSGFVYTSTATIPSGYLVDEKYQLTDTQLLAGNQTIPNYETGYDQVGNIGDGFARITFIKSAGGDSDSVATHDVLFDTSIGYLDQDVFEYTTGDVLGELPEPILDDDNYIFDGWYLDKEFTQKVNSNTVVKSSATLYAKFKYNIGQCDNLIGEQFNYDYQESYQMFKSYCPGIYKLEVWGAQGGRSLCDGSMCGTPGLGGYSTGKISLGVNERLYITTGGIGNNGNQVTCSQGGYNGGGRGTNDSGTCNQASDDDGAGAGGGATHISRMPGLLKDFEDKKNQVLIVAGGGGGSSWKYSGGSGGGYYGGRTIYTNQTMPSQTEGYSFGVGSNGSGSGASVGVAGAGGGWYGGYINDSEYNTSGTGGSGYISSELSDGIMYQYQIDTTDVMFANSLVDRDGFIEVVGVKQFNNFDKALAAIEETGTIKLLKDITFSETITIPEGKTITFDLNGYTFNTNKTIVNNGSLTLTNGVIVNNASDVIDNKGNIVIDDITIKSIDHNVILGNAVDGTITINGGNLTGKNIVNTSATQTIVVNGGTLTATSVGIYTSANNSSITINDGYINAGSYGIRTNGLSDTLTVNGGIIYGSTGIYDDKTKANNTKSTFNILGGTIETTSNGIYSVWNNVFIENTNIINQAGGVDTYALQCRTRSTCTLNSGASINNSNSSGIYVNDNAQLIINGANIYAGHASARGIYEDTNSNVTINGGSIRTPGLSSNGILINQGTATTTINDVSIESGNVGINVSNNNSSKKTYINSGSIFGKNYGVYQTISNANTTIGESTKENSTTNPSIEGGLYGLYTSTGTVSYYSGVLKGFTGAYSGAINNIRQNHDIFEDVNNLNPLLYGDRTYSVEDTSADPISKYAKEGNGYARITYSRADSITDDREVEMITDSKNNASCSKLVGKEYTFSSIGEVQTFISECAGEYKLEVWGAQGGYRSNSDKGGKGGYSSGVVNLESNDKLYVYVGSSGNNGGWNGGGSRQIGHNGGGATDIRLNDSLYSRIIVAGGGGSDGSTGNAGGYGGGTSGASTSGGCGSGGSGASQTAAGDKRAGFGYGGSGEQWSGGYGGAGGGGWYGGGGADPDGSADDDKGGGGGSGFVYTTNSILPAGYMFDQRYLLSNTELKAGNERFSSIDGTTEVYGNTGDGFAKITFVKSTNASTYKVNLVTYIGTIAESQLTYRSGQELGTIPAPTITANNLEFDGWYLDKDFTKKPASTYRVRSNLTLYARFNVNDDYCNSLINETYNFGYTGKEQQFINACPGKYKLETWGAQGGNASYNTYSYTGGYGGYSTADITLSPYETLYINVGEQGESVDYQQSTSTITYDKKTGYNGGGRAVIYTNNSAHAGGGGATHIATASGTLKSLSGFKNQILIVAGGGGGASAHSSAPSYSGNGGSGGGYTGGIGETANTTCYNYGTGGTQSGGGTYTACATDGKTDRSGAPSGPGFGYGSNYTSNASDKVYSGGGGGYYGGQSGYHAPGGGGSGYNNNSRTSNTEMYGYNLTPKYDKANTNVAYLVEAKEFITNVNKNLNYTNLQEAVNNADEEDVLQLTDNNAVSYEVTIPSTKNFTLDLNGYSLRTTKTITNNGIITITNSKHEETLSKISSTIPITLFKNSGTFISEYVDYSGYTLLSSTNAQSVVNISNTNITTTNRTITAHGTIIVDNVNINSAELAIYSNGKNTIKNSILTGTQTVYSDNTNAETKIINSSITGSNRAVQNNGSLEVSGSVLNGTSYAIVNNSSKNTAISNTTIKSSSYGIYIDNSSSFIVDNDAKEITGSIRVASGKHLKVIRGTINGNIYTAGNVTLDTVNISKTFNQRNHSFLIENDGTLTVTYCTLTSNDNYNSDAVNDVQGIYNKGTLTSTNNTYNVSNGENYRRKFVIGIQNNGILRSTNDVFNLKGGRINTTVYNVTSNSAVITNVRSTINNANDAYGFYNYSGPLTITNGTVTVTNGTNARGINVNTGDVTSTGVNYSVSGTTSYGVVVETGNATIESGNFDVDGTTARGLYVNTGTLSIGTQGDGVSTTSPMFKVTGTTTGYGISNINGTFNYYDGRVLATTNYKEQVSVTSNTEDKYQVKEGTYIDPDTEVEYNYCELEIIF